MHSLASESPVTQVLTGLGPTLPWPAMRVRVGELARVVAASHRLQYAVPRVTKGWKFVSQAGFGAGPSGSAYLRVFVTRLAWSISCPSGARYRLRRLLTSEATS
jgi:hypothetical protein